MVGFEVGVFFVIDCFVCMGGGGGWVGVVGGVVGWGGVGWMWCVVGVVVVGGDDVFDLVEGEDGCYVVGIEFGFFGVV